MRKPLALSPSSLKLWRMNREQFYIEKLCENRPAKTPQTKPQGVGSGFDARVKSALYAALFGQQHDPAYSFEALFEKQVEPHLRDWVREQTAHAFEAYLLSIAYDDLLVLLQQSSETPRFEFEVTRTIDGVPLLGKPDCRFVLGVPVILDWKVCGYMSNASPSQGYVLCRDGYLFEHSRSHNSMHKLCVPEDYRGIRINRTPFEQFNAEYAQQLAIYGWLMGETPGCSNFVAAIDELACKSTSDKPSIRVAQHRARIGSFFQRRLLDIAKHCWQCIESGHVFSELSREDSDSRCATLDAAARSMPSDYVPELSDQLAFLETNYAAV